MRDFDIVDVREGATIEGRLYTRRFEVSSMVVLPIVIGQGAGIGSKAVVYGGTKIGSRR